MEPLLQTLAELSLPTWIRASAWAYPMINILHVIGIATLFGTIFTVDLRLLGIAKVFPLLSIMQFLLPLTLCGFILAVSTGGLMFAVDPVKYWNNPFFPWKIFFIVASAVNAALFHLLTWKKIDTVEALSPVIPRIHGALSIVFWLSVIICGRLMAYF